MKTTNSNTSIAVHSPALPMPVFPGGALMGTFQKSGGLITRAWNWIRERQVVRSCSRRLHVAATASLGEKRFVAVVQMDGLEFLVGGGASNVVLLAELNGKKQFKDVLEDRIADREEVAIGDAERQIAGSTMRPKVQSFINATAKKIVRPAIEHFVKPATKTVASRVVEPVGTAAAELSLPRVRRAPAAKAVAKPVARSKAPEKEKAGKGSRPAAKTTSNSAAQSKAKPKAKKPAAAAVTKPSPSKAARKSTGTAAKRAGK